ncbi:hypothetical protein DH2020_030793 [Rehmannia glutinosa]|uniref:HVA22-like protein n=1 Tax=Rehmannia glutinosa TaxID=99300 RepID=A0ABR0VLI7_REHGL
MGFMGLLKIALFCIHFLAWPVIALGYPLFASIRAIETGSKYHMKKVVIYWTIFSIISLFEFAFVKIIEWIPLWSSIKLVAIFWLVIPRFHGACYAYQSFIRPFLVVNLQAIINRFYMSLEEQPHKKEMFLDVANKYIRENGSEALEKPISSKMDHKEPDNSQRETQVLEPDEKNYAATSKQLKEPDAARKDNELLEAQEKSAATESKQQSQEETTYATAKTEYIKTPDQASADNNRSQPSTPPPKTIQQEWTCPLCQVTTTSEKTLNAHLQGSKHKSMCESLKTSKLNKLKDTTPPIASAENRQPPSPPMMKKVEPEWTCALCQVTTTCEKNLKDHLRGQKHKAMCESLETSKLNAKDKANQGNPETGKNKAGEGYGAKSCEKAEERVQHQVSSNQQFKVFCNVCNVKLLSEIDMASHLKGKRHSANIQMVIKEELCRQLILSLARDISS